MKSQLLIIGINKKGVYFLNKNAAYYFLKYEEIRDCNLLGLLKKLKKEKKI